MRAAKLTSVALLVSGFTCLDSTEPVPSTQPPVSDPPVSITPPKAPAPPENAGTIGDDIDTDVIYSHGPTKLMMPEQILASIEKLTGHEFDRGTPPYRITAPESGRLTASWVAHCQAMGGCPDHVTRERITTSSIIHAMTLDRVALEACVLDDEATAMLPPNAPIDEARPSPHAIDDAINWQYHHFFREVPNQDELDASRDYFVSHLDEPGNDLQSALRGHCVALLTSTKLVYY